MYNLDNLRERFKNNEKELQYYFANLEAERILRKEFAKRGINAGFHIVNAKSGLRDNDTAIIECGGCLDSFPLSLTEIAEIDDTIREQGYVCPSCKMPKQMFGPVELKRLFGLGEDQFSEENTEEIGVLETEDEDIDIGVEGSESQHEEYELEYNGDGTYDAKNITDEISVIEDPVAAVNEMREEEWLEDPFEGVDLDDGDEEDDDTPLEVSDEISPIGIEYTKEVQTKIDDVKEKLAADNIKTFPKVVTQEEIDAYLDSNTIPDLNGRDPITDFGDYVVLTTNQLRDKIHNAETANTDMPEELPSDYLIFDDDDDEDEEDLEDIVEDDTETIFKYVDEDGNEISSEEAADMDIIEEYEEYDDGLQEVLEEETEVVEESDDADITEEDMTDEEISQRGFTHEKDHFDEIIGIPEESSDDDILVEGVITEPEDDVEEPVEEAHIVVSSNITEEDMTDDEIYNKAKQEELMSYATEQEEKISNETAYVNTEYDKVKDRVSKYGSISLLEFAEIANRLGGSPSAEDVYAEFLRNAEESAIEEKEIIEEVQEEPKVVVEPIEKPVPEPVVEEPKVVQPVQPANKVDTKTQILEKLDVINGSLLGLSKEDGEYDKYRQALSDLHNGRPEDYVKQHLLQPITIEFVQNAAGQRICKISVSCPSCGEKRNFRIDMQDLRGDELVKNIINFLLTKVVKQRKSNIRNRYIGRCCLEGKAIRRSKNLRLAVSNLNIDEKELNLPSLYNSNIIKILSLMKNDDNTLYLESIGCDVLTRTDVILLKSTMDPAMVVPISVMGMTIGRVTKIVREYIATGNPIVIDGILPIGLPLTPNGTLEEPEKCLEALDRIGNIVTDIIHAKNENGMENVISSVTEKIIETEDDLKSQSKLDKLAAMHYSILSKKRIYVSDIPNVLKYTYSGANEVTYRCPNCLGEHKIDFSNYLDSESKDTYTLFSDIIGNKEEFSKVFTTNGYISGNENVLLAPTDIADIDVNCVGKYNSHTILEKIFSNSNILRQVGIELPYYDGVEDSTIFDSIPVEKETSGAIVSCNANLLRLLSIIKQAKEQGLGNDEYESIRLQVDSMDPLSEKELQDSLELLSKEDRDFYVDMMDRNVDTSFFNGSQINTSVTQLRSEGYKNEEAEYTQNQFLETDLFRVFKNAAKAMKYDIDLKAAGEKNNILLDIYASDTNIVYRYLFMYTKRKHQIMWKPENADVIYKSASLRAIPCHCDGVDNNTVLDFNIIYEDTEKCLPALEHKLFKQIGVVEKIYPEHVIELGAQVDPIFYTVGPMRNNTAASFYAEQSHNYRPLAKSSVHMLYIMVPVPNKTDNGEFNPNQVSLELPNNIYKNWTQHQRDAEQGLRGKRTIYQVCGITFYMEKPDIRSEMALRDRRYIITEYIESGITKINDGLSKCVSALLNHASRELIANNREEEFITIFMEEDLTDMYHDGVKADINKYFGKLNQKGLYVRDYYRRIQLDTGIRQYIPLAKDDHFRIDGRYLSNPAMIRDRFPKEYQEFLEAEPSLSPETNPNEFMRGFSQYMQLIPIISPEKEYHTLSFDAQMELRMQAHMMTERSDKDNIQNMIIDPEVFNRVYFYTLMGRTHNE